MNEIAYRKSTKREFVPKPKPKAYEILHQEVGSGISYEEKPNRSKPKSDGDWYKNENTNMSKKLIRLTESDLHRIVKESVNKVLREAEDGNISMNDADWVALGQDRIRNLFKQVGKGEISWDEAWKEYEKEQSWQALRLNGYGKVNQSKADWAKFQYDSPQGRIDKYWFGAKDDPQIPQENPNLLDLHRTY